LQEEQPIPAPSIARVHHAPSAMFSWSRQTLIRYWGPTILWLVVVTLFSSANGGASHTGTILQKILQALHVKLSGAQFSTLHFAVRKSAHFLTYMTLSFLAFRTFRGPKAERRHRWNYRWALLALAVCLFTASGDEFHQKFTPGRGASPKDVALDMTGALFAQIFIASWTAGQANGRRRFLTLE
jgi:VanZ family protein